MAAHFSWRTWLLVLAGIAGASSGCSTVRGPDGEKALWSTVDSSPATHKDLKDPTKVNIAYARWQEQLGQMNEARQFYKLALDDNPKSVEAILGIARLDQLAGREQQAEAGIKQALELKPNEPLVLHAAGQHYAAKKQWQQAGDLLSRAMTGEPENVTYRYDFAVVLARAGRPDQALPHFAKCVGEAEGHYNIAYILQQQGRSDLAEQHLVIALKQRPELKQARSLLAEVRGVQNDRSALANAQQPQSNGVSQASLNVARPAAGSQPQVVRQQPRMTPNSPARAPISSNPQAMRNNIVSPGASSRPQTPVREMHMEDQQLEQWNNQTSSW